MTSHGKDPKMEAAIAIDGAPGPAGAHSRGEAAQVDALRLTQTMRPRARGGAGSVEFNHRRRTPQ